jgi:environmental stress-induced protein Ves
MIRFLTGADYRAVPWANGRGTTVEMLRIEQDGAVLLRLSRAAVVEDGEFSLFDGIDRNLTVISGPGFDLVGDDRLAARPLQPVTFAGDVAIRAEGVTGPCEDFNVMVRRGVVRAEVEVLSGGVATGTTALFALGSVQAAGRIMEAHDLILTDAPLEFLGQAVLVSLHGLPDNALK